MKNEDASQPVGPNYASCYGNYTLAPFKHGELPAPTIQPYIETAIRQYDPNWDYPAMYEYLEKELEVTNPVSDQIFNEIGFIFNQPDWFYYDAKAQAYYWQRLDELPKPIYSLYEEYTEEKPEWKIKK